MALSILDGNQSATTLSTILSSGQHITAHTVVSLGTQAITDMRGAVSGSVVSISNFPASQVISGTVTANPTGTQTIAGTVTVGGFSSVSVGSGALLAAGLRSGGVEPLSLDIATGYLQVKVESSLPAGTNRIGVVTIGAGTVTLGASTSQIGSVTASISGTVPVSISSVTVGNSVTIGSLPAISGTVTANINDPTNNLFTVQIGDALFGSDQLLNALTNLPISGTVTIGSALPAGTNRIGVVTIGAGTVTIGAGTAQIGSVTASVSKLNDLTSDGGGAQPSYGIQLGFSTEISPGDDYVLVAPSNPLPISGTVTANSSNGSLTTRFGSVTTANTAFATSAVTNANRKYLLIQNITTASNVITVGIGFTPTTTQGIQLFAGAGLTFEGTYIPTGAVNLLSSVTASCYTILEA